MIDHQDNTMSTAETVHTMTAYYDGPRSGIADYLGQPHLYESLWDTSGDDEGDLFELMPLDRQTFTLAMEAWAIWLRWEAAFTQGRTALETHPALPMDRKRHGELEASLHNKLKIRHGEGIRCFGCFSVADHAPGKGVTAHKWTVVWRAETAHAA